MPNQQQNNAQSKADIAAWILDENNNDLSTLTARNILPENVNTNTRIQEANVPNRVPTPSTGPSRGNISNNSSSVHPVSSSISMSSSNKLNHSASNNSNAMTTTTNTNSLSSKSNSIVSSNNASNASKYTIDPKSLPFYETPVSLYYDQLCTFHNYKHFEQFDEDYDEHPEDPKRVAEIFDSICKNKRLFVPEKVHETITAQGRPALGPGYKKTVTKTIHKPKINVFHNKSRFAKKEEILLAHDEAHYNQVQTFKDLDDKALFDLSSRLDSLYLSRTTEMSASVGLGTCLQAADDLIQNHNLQAAYCLTRPPGHHAYRHKGSGFCIYNNAAIVAKYITKNTKFKRVLILDWDIHHGNGTQDITKDDPHIMFISMHRHDNGNYYPWLEPEMCSKFLGEGKGKGLNINLPFSKRTKTTKIKADGSGGGVTKDHDLTPYKNNNANKPEMSDLEYFYVLENVIKPLIQEFEPQFTIISNGLDAGRGDPLGKYGITPEFGFSGMLHRILNYTLDLNHNRKHSVKCPIMLILEGGYNLNTLKTASNSMIEFLVNYFRDRRESSGSSISQRTPSILPFKKTNIKDIKNSLLLDLQTIVKDYLYTWQQREFVKNSFMGVLNDVADEIERRERVIESQMTPATVSKPVPKSLKEVKREGREKIQAQTTQCINRNPSDDSSQSIPASEKNLPVSSRTAAKKHGTRSRSGPTATPIRNDNPSDNTKTSRRDRLIKNPKLRKSSLDRRSSGSSEQSNKNCRIEYEVEGLSESFANQTIDG